MSEVVYTYKNDSPFLRNLYLYKAKSESAKNNTDNALKYLFMATKLRINYQAPKYSKLFTKKDFNDNSDIVLKSNYKKDVYIDYLKNLNSDLIVNMTDSDFLILYYNLALIAQDNNYTNDVLPLLKIAMYMQPELSHIHIEIANYYLLNGQLDKAIDQIDECISLVSPRYHCSLYKDNQLKNIVKYPIGFLKDSIATQNK